MNKRLRQGLASVVLALAFLGSYSFVSAALDRDPPIVFEGVRALADSVPQGGDIGVEFKVFRKRICETTVKRYLTDARGQRHSIPTYTVGIQQLAGRETYQRSITVPQAAATGKACYTVSLDYDCNLFHKLGAPIHVDSPPACFEVTPSTSYGPLGGTAPNNAP